MNQDEITALRGLQRDLKEASQDRDMFKEATLYLFNNLIVNQGYGDGVYEEKTNGEKLSRYDIACHHLAANIDMIYDHTESPIETLFLCSLLTTAMRFSPFILTITTPIVADVFPSKMFALHQRASDLR